MRILLALGILCVAILAGLTVCRAAPAADNASGAITGFAFVNSSVTSQGSRARLPAGTKIYPPGAKITGTDGCPTTSYRTDGLIVAVIDYQGRPTSGSIAVMRRPAAGGSFENAPYYLDLDSGRTLQFLGPIFDNGSYDVRFAYHYAEGQEKTASASFTLARSCPTAR
jgi:hypothetical protein